MSSKHVFSALLCGVLGGLLLSLPAVGQERARTLEPAAARADVTFDVFVPPAPDPALDALLRDQVTPGSPTYHRFLTPAAYRARFATAPDRMAVVTAELRRAGLTVQPEGAHMLRATGSVDRVQRVFATTLSRGTFPSGRTALVATSGLRLPASLAAQGAVVAGLAPAIRMRRHSLPTGLVTGLGTGLGTGRIAPDSRMGRAGPYWFDDLKQAYDLPDERVLNGKGVAIGILMAGAYNPGDMARYFNGERLSVPAITVEAIYGGAAYSRTGSLETHLDIQQAGGMAPKAAIKLYNLPDLSDGSILAGLARIDEENAVDIVSMSFGAPELVYTAAFNGGQDDTGLLLAMDALFKQGNAEGITFVASSGDSGALAGPPAACFLPNAGPYCGFFGPSAEHPASSPYVTAVGGTNLLTAADPSHPDDLDSAYRDENAYYDRLAYDPYYNSPALGAIWGSGGGVSLFEPRPDWQKLAPTGSARFRTVPDVAGHMGGCVGAAILPCPRDRSGDIVEIGGKLYGVAGTSASAPDFAGILALKAQHLQSRLGNENLDIYTLGQLQREHRIAPVFRDHIPGNNGFFAATPGYNLVLGNGTVRARAFIGVPGMAAAGVPRGPSNP